MLGIRKLQLADKAKSKKVEDRLRGLVLSDAAIERIKVIFESEMDLALDMKPSSLQMENTYIPELPDGSETGTYLAMDLGGTNMRVLLMNLTNGEVTNETVDHFGIPDELRVGCGDALFDYLAQCIDTFAVRHKLRDDYVYPLGFTFSFPMRQNGLDSGILVTWTKSFNCPSIVGEDVVQKLRQGLAKLNRHNVEVIAILNDTTGTLVHGAQEDKQTRIGIVLGTGSNACFIENANRVKHWEQQRHGERHVIIDIEWGAFGDNGVLDFIRTEFDRTVDEGSLLKNSFTFEKYIGGKYLGEVGRAVLQQLHDDGLFLPNLASTKMPEPWSFGSDNVSAIEESTLNNNWDNMEKILSEYFDCTAKDYKHDDLEIMRYVCGLISLRAAQLVAINVSVLLNRMDFEYEGLEQVTVAIDGSVYKHHPRLHRWLEDLTREWAPTKPCKYILSEDGSGKGAALVAAIAEKLRKRSD